MNEADIKWLKNKRSKSRGKEEEEDEPIYLQPSVLTQLQLSSVSRLSLAYYFVVGEKTKPSLDYIIMHTMYYVHYLATACTRTVHGRLHTVEGRCKYEYANSSLV